MAMGLGAVLLESLKALDRVSRDQIVRHRCWWRYVRVNALFFYGAGRRSLLGLNP